jgi:NAD+ synthase
MDKDKISLKQDTQFVLRVIAKFIQEEVNKYGFNGGVIALSGGLDSSVVSMLSYQALDGKIRLLFMPYGENSIASKDASSIASLLNISLETYNLKEIADKIFLERKIDDKLRKGNILARLRMSLLFDVSAREKALVIGTSNKSELLIGYSTWFGDSAAGIQPIGDLYKTQVRELAKCVGVPDEIIKKPPSAELWEGQSDEEEIGISYDDLDKILYLYVDKRFNEEEIIKMGFEANLVRKVILRTKKALYKLRTPVICKLSDRTIGIDYRYSKEVGII